MRDWLLRWGIVWVAAGMAAGLAPSAVVRRWRLMRLLRETEATCPRPGRVGESGPPIEVGEVAWLGSSGMVW